MNIALIIKTENSAKDQCRISKKRVLTKRSIKDVIKALKRLEPCLGGEY